MPMPKCGPISFLWRQSSLQSCLRQLRHIQRSLDPESMNSQSLAHVFIVTSLCLLERRSLRLTRFNVYWILQHSKKVRPRLISSASRRPRLSGCSWACEVQAKCDVHRCLQHKAPQYLMDCCTPVSHVSGRQRLCSASRHYHDIGAVRSAVGSSLSLVRRAGARCQSTFEIRRTVMITLQSHWRRGCFEDTRITSVLSGLEVSSRRYAM